MFINLSNHPVGSWSKEQIEATKIYGEIIEYPFPQIPVSISDEEMNRLVSKYFELIMQHDQPVVMLQGEFVFVFRLVTRLKKAGIKVLAACSERVATEVEGANGSRIKTSEFRFACYREF